MLRYRKHDSETDDSIEGERKPLDDIPEVLEDWKDSDNQTCRICLKESKVPIFVGIATEKLFESISEIGGIEVCADDPYPKFLCQSCHALLRGAILFRKTAQLSDNLLKKQKAAEKPAPALKIYVHTNHSDQSDSDYTDDTPKKTSLCKHTDQSDQSDNDYTEDKPRKMSISEHTDHSNQSDNDCTEYTPKKKSISEHSDQSDYDYTETPKQTSLGEHTNQTDERKTKKINIKKNIKLNQTAKCLKRRRLCTRCDLSFSTFKEYRVHILSTEHENKRIECKLCKKSFSHNYYRKHSCVRNPLYKPRVTDICDICGKKFTAKSHLKKHRLIHFDDRPYECPYCPYRGKLPQVLRMHIRTHTGEKPYQCTLCPSRFINKGGFNLHMLTHKGKRDFHCKICGKGFYLKRDLELHIKVNHEGIKEFVCGTCGKAFGYRSLLTKHQRRVHMKTKQENTVAA